MTPIKKLSHNCNKIISFTFLIKQNFILIKKNQNVKL